MKKITTLVIAAALAASMTVPASAASLLFSKTSFVSNGGTEFKPVLTTIGYVIDLEKYVPEREGYTFTGWYKDAALTEAVTELRSGDLIKIYAGWAEIVPEEPEEVEETEETEEVEAPVDTEEAAE